MKIQKIATKQFQYMLQSWERGEEKFLGLYYLAAGRTYIGVDNTTDNFWVEEFSNLRRCKSWLRGEFACGTVEEMVREAAENVQQYVSGI